MKQNMRAVIIGAGVSGMMAAGFAGSRKLEVIIVEKNKEPGRKLMITGKGRCNITNITDLAGLVAGVPVNEKFLYSAFNQFSSGDLLEFLHNLGLKTKSERGRRVFPVSDSAADVVDTMKKHLLNNNVKIKKGEAAGIIIKDKKVCGISLKEGGVIEATSVIVATGGLSYPQTGSTGDGYRFARECGHTVTPLKPSLVPLNVKESWVTELQGLSLRNVGIKVFNGKKDVVFEDFGEMIFTHFGVSGPVILSASSFMRDIEKENYIIAIDLKPALTEKQLDNRIQRDFQEFSRKIFANSLDKLFPKKLIPVMVKLSGIPAEKPVNQISKKERETLGFIIKNLSFEIESFRPVEEAIITSGGVSVSQINPSTMESKIIKGLFFAGEVIDVDGYTGGYNLQIAFSTGFVAGLNC